MVTVNLELATSKKVFKKRGTAILSKTLFTSILVLASAVVVFLIIKTVLCKTGAWTSGVC